MAFFLVGRRACGGGESMRDISKRNIAITILGLPVCAKNLLRYATEVRRWLENRQLAGSYIRWYIVRIELNPLLLTSVNWVVNGFG